MIKPCNGCGQDIIWLQHRGGGAYHNVIGGESISPKKHVCPNGLSGAKPRDWKRVVCKQCNHVALVLIPDLYKCQRCLRLDNRMYKRVNVLLPYCITSPAPTLELS